VEVNTLSLSYFVKNRKSEQIIAAKGAIDSQMKLEQAPIVPMNFYLDFYFPRDARVIEYLQAHLTSTSRNLRREVLDSVLPH